MNYKIRFFILVLILVISGCTQKTVKREALSLNGTWEFAESGSFDEIPSEFSGSVQVPGLIDMAVPKADTPYTDKVYWYRKSFSIDQKLPDVAMLKINKAMYHTKVILNKKEVGENYYCFTPSFFDLRKFLNDGNAENELLIAIGCYNNLPDTILNGHDFERINYIPGIYDEVEIQLTGYPYIENVQTAPDLQDYNLRVKAWFRNDEKSEKISLKYNIMEVSTGKIVSEGDTSFKGDVIDFRIPMTDYRPWSPEDPFLYELSLNTGNDVKNTKFGMRSFSFDDKNGVALLNGKPYYMRGTNISILRFFEDPVRGNLPWDYKWAARLHEKFKSMHWNSARWCIGFPPERWYEIADSMGFLIQDEYPLWAGMRNVKSQHLVKEYTEWMKDRWNHPCVVIWDSQNETITEETGKAINLVRGLDLQDRPWDNGWSPPQAATDPMETHPYLMEYLIDPGKSDKAPWTDLYTTIRIPQNGPSERSPSPGGKEYQNPIIINEYEWLWLNRDGSPTTLTDRVYERLLGKNATKEQRFEIYARILAMDTEYWRAHRKCAGVLYFTGLGYSRSKPPRGQTCDNFTDVKNLVFEPYFEKYLKSAFAPVGLMADMWNARYKMNTELNVPVYVFNDTYTEFSDTLKITIYRGNELLKEISHPVSVAPLGEEIFNIPVKMPDVQGKCTFSATIKNGPEDVVSRREFVLVP